MADLEWSFAAALPADALRHSDGQRFLPSELGWKSIVAGWVNMFRIQLRPLSSSPISFQPLRNRVLTAEHGIKSGDLHLDSYGQLRACLPPSSPNTRGRIT